MVSWKCFKAREPACPRKDSVYQLPMGEPSLLEPPFSLVSSHGSVFTVASSWNHLQNVFKTEIWWNVYVNFFFFFLLILNACKQRIKNWSNDEYVISKTELVLKATTVTVLSESFRTKCKQGISSVHSIKILHGFGLEIRNLHSVLISLY